MAKILFDCRAEKMYPLAKPGFSGGSQVYVKAIINGLANKGHQVHVIAPDLDVDQQPAPNQFWWPPSYYPKQCDIAVMQMHAVGDPDYDAPLCILMTSCVDPYLGPDHSWAKSFDAIPVFSEVHKRLLCKMRPVDPEKIFITGLGVDLDDYDISSAWKIPGKMLYANDPARGLFYTMDIFDLVKLKVPEATLHIAYDFDTQLSWRMWEHSQMADMLLDCKHRIACTPGMVNLGALSRQEVINEQLACHVHCMPSDPPGIGTQTHGLTQLECAAAGTPLVLSDIEAFPEIFGDAAIILPTMGRFLPDEERRVTAHDYAEMVIELMTNPDLWLEYSQKSIHLAKQHSWTRVVDNWTWMLGQLLEVESLVS